MLTQGTSIPTLNPPDSIAFDHTSIQQKLLNLHQPCYVFLKNNQIGISHQPIEGIQAQMMVNAILPQKLGDRSFLDFHGVNYAYAAGAMAGGIASEILVITLGKAGFLASFGSAGLVPQRVEKAILQIQQALPTGPYAFNLIHSPSEEALEQGAVELYLKHGVRTVEASAYMDLTPHIVRYRAAGLHLNSQGEIQTHNKVIAKISRSEVAQKFLQPAPLKFLKSLVEQGYITPLQAALAEKVPLADDITVEADSGGHTDNRSLVCLLPSIIALRDEIQQQYHYEHPVRVGAAGGIGTPEAALAAFMMGASYIVTGSINHSCIEAGTSDRTKQLLAQASMADMVMAPCADMFEMGVKVQLLKRGSLFPMRAQKLYDFYKTYGGIEEIPPEIRQTLETQIFRKNLDQVWDETVAYFSQRDPEQIARANNNPKRKMALIFRWYLGLSSRWSTSGDEQRQMDYQIWCGPAMGSFNEWVRGSYLELPENRTVVDVATHIMQGAAYLYRLQNLKLQGLNLPSQYCYYRPFHI
ncbi:2-nitropropane dioxygenase, NPD [Trichormus variabilis ATCC 29413]|uniref:2-nitropropane dioxygenase, NPD n=2 Tax=Anabaena variabilis TaxID=264691 RepID=Q3M3T8_TRIV2|nr:MULTISPECIES: PfaD family polyunsaturated fatty acid/polyketide biosynthesis protein [Nostocaceae]ABA24348.1 2-nitropropane dioxygenase, NPD [Trichormus variabilis ATCC 29413]MBC1213107.1 PfaD family polyunsaturated fatty acid/polyketide biosynthesis protein [Trichormus variabilis ARAD]MBC1256503.1 PfaD family polyunsaturated fatty acid/polyketide biosynthesis protein [Trichormus variabilis V5]MBC1266125.1 PfaD family polyunsaturated fatty acid/polyketide biosynthesis protein [Trichormus var